jgi:hypothetical protein
LIIPIRVDAPAARIMADVDLPLIFGLLETTPDIG